MNIQETLAGLFPPQRLKTSLVEKLAYAGDAGFYQLIPEAVVQPADEEEVARLFGISRQFGIPLVFRAAGTSLSGQSITNGILVDIGKHWGKAEIGDHGNWIKTQPGIIGARVNQLLRPYGRKMGPDPASINAAMMGGILANNASGMCCGVAYNSYHTLRSIRFMLPDGSIYDTGHADDYHRFENEHAGLFEKLSAWRGIILHDAHLLEKIRRKYRMKNTVGYSLNALVDYEHPLDILAHLLIGSEGTLGFIIHATLLTLPDHPCKATAMLYFPGIYEACSAIGVLRESGAEALELMDRSALRSVEHLPGLPSFFSSLPDGAAALLCEYQAADNAALEDLLEKATLVCKTLPLLYPADFTQNEQQRQFFWKIRKGMFPSVGAVRQRGTTVILEDIAFPLPVLADALTDLQKLFEAFGYDNAIIFGHAKEGNIHFVITQLLDREQEIDRYDRFMRAVVDLVLKKYDGALKAEHGTGRNMAPFVEAEWGSEAYRIMREIKETIDPDNLLNPGVIINDDPQAHLRDLKQMPQVEEEVDKCIECGFCENHCPSRDVTLTPRQRIQVRRHLRQLEAAGNHKVYRQLVKEYQYAGLDTCATDGLCQLECPVSINTGELVKRLRAEQHGRFSRRIAMAISRHFGLAEGMLKVGIRLAWWVNHLSGGKFLPAVTRGIKKLIPAMPLWWNELQPPPQKIFSTPSNPEVVYLSACIQRMMGNDRKKGSVQQQMVTLCRRAGIEVLLPPDLSGHCCGQAFSSKGYFDAARYRQEQLVDALWKWTRQGALPVVCDFTSCTYTFLKAGSHLGEAYRAKWEKLQVLDSLAFLEKTLLPRLSITQPKTRVILHPGCAATKLQLGATMQQVATRCAHEAVVPSAAGCCGMAGDRGFLFPELTQGATRHELHQATESPADGYYGSAKTCEMALSHYSGKPYEHMLYLVEETTRP